MIHENAKIKIVSDGTPGGTHVIDANGNRFDNVRSVSWSCGVGQASIATIEFVNVAIETEVNTVDTNEPEE